MWDAYGSNPIGLRCSYVVLIIDQGCIIVWEVYKLADVEYIQDVAVRKKDLRLRTRGTKRGSNPPGSGVLHLIM